MDIAVESHHEPSLEFTVAIVQNAQVVLVHLDG